MEVNNWAIIQGEGTITAGSNLSYKYDAKKDKESESNDTFQNTVFRSDKYFKEGVVTFKSKFSTHNSSIALVLYPKTKDTNKEVCIIGYSRVEGEFVIKLGDKILSQAGGLKNYNIGEEIEFKIETKGSLVILKINNIEMCRANVEIMEHELEIILNGEGQVGITNIQLNATALSAFVVMQFSEEYDQLYNEVIKPICKDAGIECIRADEIFFSSPIIKDIIENIINSSLIIAEITPDNPNVFYEIGYAHAIDKPTILLCDKKRGKLPFDLSGFRTIFYEDSIVGKRKVEDNLKKYLSNIFRMIT